VPKAPFTGAFGFSIIHFMNKNYLSRVFIVVILIAGSFFAVSKFMATRDTPPPVLDESKTSEFKEEVIK
jgi:hypothetical protein